MFNLFKKKKPETKANTQLGLKVREVVRETPDTVTLYFEQPEPHLEYKPGQFLTLIMEFEGKEQRRSYSLCTSPYVDPFPGISVKKVDGGLFSNHLNEKVFPGKTINSLMPMGNFTTDFHSQNRRHLVMVAGGSGITPIMGILKSALINEPKSKVTLLYCSRNEEQIIFRDALAELAQKESSRLDVIHILSQPEPGWNGITGRITKELITSEVAKAEADEAFEKEYFVCGPEGIMDQATDVLKDLEIEKSKIHRESFYSSAVEDEKGSSVASGGLTREVTVILEGEENKVQVSPDSTILEAGLDQLLDMPYSCQSGLCTACRGRLLGGEVKMVEDAGLSDKEKSQGYILCCVSKPLTDDVKVMIE